MEMIQEERTQQEIKELLDGKQYTRLRQRAAELNDADIAAAMEEMEEKDLLKMFRILPKSMAADVFSYLEVESQQFIITSLSERDAADIIDNLMSDDAADLLEEMPANVVKKLLAEKGYQPPASLSGGFRGQHYDRGVYGLQGRLHRGGRHCQDPENRYGFRNHQYLLCAG